MNLLTGDYYDENGRHIRYRVRHSTGFKIPGKKTNTKKGPKFVYWDDLQQYARRFMDAEEINGYVIALINRVSKYVRHQKESFEPVDLYSGFLRSCLLCNYSHTFKGAP